MLNKLINYTKFLKRITGVLKLVEDLNGTSPILIPDEFEQTVDRFYDKPAFLFEGQWLSFSQFEQQANRVAHWATEQNFTTGDTVALVMENCPTYVAIWIGLSKVGVATALINSNLEGISLAHCINIIGVKAIIASNQQARNVNAIAKELNGKPPIWDYGGKNGFDLKTALNMQSDKRPDRERRKNLLGNDTCLHIYTSGTTGLPKAARVNHARLRRTWRMALILTQIKPSDIVYNTLPLYHITGGGLGIGATLYSGATTHLRRKFSASEFWDDVCESQSTIFVYIGELCSYLINSVPHPKELNHKLRAGFGNGLRGDVWRIFVNRFNVPTMRELYGSTEGNVTFLNLDGKIGAIGQIPSFLDKKMGIAFVKFDIENEMPIRDDDGFCIKCDVDEIGEVLGRIDEGHASFEGYHNKKATKEKILTHVFESNDKWFRTGDLMRRDHLGYVSFVDRIGDTFRWKGENVSTNEVANVLIKFEGIELANVYGVEVPGTDGRAGMAAITTHGDLDYQALVQHVTRHLPIYAIPIFLRLQAQADTTGTFKFRKVDAINDGFNPKYINDTLLFLPQKSKSYKTLTSDIFAKISAGHIKL